MSDDLDGHGEVDDPELRDQLRGVADGGDLPLAEMMDSVGRRVRVRRAAKVSLVGVLALSAVGFVAVQGRAGDAPQLQTAGTTGGGDQAPGSSEARVTTTAPPAEPGTTSETTAMGGSGSTAPSPPESSPVTTTTLLGAPVTTTPPPDETTPSLSTPTPTAGQTCHPFPPPPEPGTTPVTGYMRLGEWRWQPATTVPDDQLAAIRETLGCHPPLVMLVPSAETEGVGPTSELVVNAYQPGWRLDADVYVRATPESPSPLGSVSFGMAGSGEMCRPNPDPWTMAVVRGGPGCTFRQGFGFDVQWEEQGLVFRASVSTSDTDPTAALAWLATWQPILIAS